MFSISIFPCLKCKFKKIFENDLTQNTLTLNLFCLPADINVNRR